MDDIIIKEIKEISENKNLEINKKTPLIGDTSALDSMGLVNLCIRLEEIAEDQGFQFDWSGETLSKSKSMFLNIETLSKEFLSQKNNT
tara:strand:+ start:17 stop:280 length:264 start_codon:yes stop_codon:yes gene_type:complete